MMKELVALCREGSGREEDGVGVGGRVAFGVACDMAVYVCVEES